MEAFQNACIEFCVGNTVLESYQQDKQKLEEELAAFVETHVEETLEVLSRTEDINYTLLVTATLMKKIHMTSTKVGTNNSKLA